MRKANRTFWYTVVAGLAMVVLGYFGFLAFMPDKTSSPFLPLLCFLIFTLGALVLVGSLGFAITKIVMAQARKGGQSMMCEIEANQTQEANRQAKCPLGLGWKLGCPANAPTHVFEGGRSAFC